MAYFAEVGLNNRVLRVIVVSNDVLKNSEGVETESLGADFCRDIYGGTWVQTSYNSSFRKNYASPGDVYDSVRDAFYSPNPPYASWTLEDSTCRYKAPVDAPEDGKAYFWDESVKEWKEVT
jgi:hypothetical protein